MSRDDPTAFAPPPAFGPFRVLHQVGVGALGPVFRTYEPTRDRLVAVKVFRLDITPEQAQALADELTVAAQAGLFHPSIVEPIAAGVEGSVAYRAEEYVAAESLDVAMRHYAPATLDKVLPFISQLAAAIDFARMNGVGHGALHPRDIFVTPDEARATGFGVVEALERVGLRAPVRRPYSAPERVAGTQWGTAADVFSLGAITYELLTGRRPAGVGAAAGDLSGASVGTHGDAIHAVLVRTMEEDPAARFASAMAFAAALEAAARGEAVPAAAAAPAPAPSASDPDDVVSSFHSREADTTIAPPPVTPEVDDIEAERDEDEAFAAFVRGAPVGEIARDSDQPRDLFDFEEAGGGAIDSRHDRFRDESDPHVLVETPPPPPVDEPAPAEVLHETPAPASLAAPAIAAAAHSERPKDDHKDEDVDRNKDNDRGFDRLDDEDDLAYVPPPRRSIDYVQDDTYGAPPTARRPVWQLAVMLLIGLIIGFGGGFGAGYGAGNRSKTTSADEAKAEAGDEQPADAAQQKPEGGKAYSDQAVSPSTQKPPSEPPPIPGDAPAPPVSGATTPAKPSAPATAGVTTGRLIVRSVPPNAGVTVDGTWRGRTPLTLDQLRLGSHEVRVVQPGFAVGRQTIALTPTAPARTLSFRLQPEGAAAPSESPAAPSAKPPAPSQPPTAPPEQGLPPVEPEPRGPGSLYVDSRPRGAAVFLDGKQVGVTPTTIRDVTPGPHVIRLQLPEHRVWTTNTQVLPGQQTSVRGSLERIQ